MKEVVRSPYVKEVRNDSTDGKGGNRLKKSLVAIALLAFVLISTGAYATAPKPADIPDFRAIVGQAAPDVTDLDAWVVDFDDKSFIGNEDLTWQANPSGGLTVSLDANNLLTLDDVASVNQSVVDFTVSDASGPVPAVTSAYKATNAIGIAPALSSDPLLGDSDTLYTYVLQPAGGAGAVVTQLGGLAKVSGTAPTWESVYINATDGTTLASGLGSASVGGLSAAIDAAGNFTLTSTGVLTDPVIVGFKGSIAADPNDWVGVSALVSNSLLAESRSFQVIAPAYDINEGWETASTGEITRVGFIGLGYGFNRIIGAALNNWVQNVERSDSASYGNGYVSAVVAAAPGGMTPDASFPGDFSGQVLQIQLGGSAGAYAAWVQLNSAFPASAGKVYCFEANVASNAASPAVAPQVALSLATAGFSEIALVNVGGNTASTSTNSMPAAGEGWAKLRVYLEPSAEGLADSAAPGIFPIIVALNQDAGGTPLTNPVSVYIDNVKVYETVSPEDLSFAAAKVDAIPSRPDVAVGTARKQIYVNPSLANVLAGQPLYGNFEAGTGAVTGTTAGGANGWLTVLAAPGTSASVVGTSASTTRIEQGDANWLELDFNGTQAIDSAVAVQSRQLTPSNQTNVFWQPGTYVLSVDLETPAAQTTSNDAYIIIQDNGFQSFAYTVIDQPTNGAIRRVRLPYTFRDVDILQISLAGVTGSDDAGFSGQIHFDNVMLEYLDDAPAEYNDESLFQ